MRGRLVIRTAPGRINCPQRGCCHVRLKTHTAVRNDYSLARLYAMGADAWSLANHFTQMRQTPGFELNGNTGDLTATQDCVITRKLSWLKYQQGQIVPAS